MLIQLLSFKYDVCHKEFEPKSAATSWNATSSCLLSSHLPTPRGQLRMRIASFYKLLKILLALHTWRPLHTLLELLLNIKGPRDLNYIQSQSYSYVLWRGIWECFLACLRFEVTVQGCCDVIKWMKKRISTPNFETSSHQNVTAKKPIGNMYFMYVDMAWFQSL